MAIEFYYGLRILNGLFNREIRRNTSRNEGNAYQFLHNILRRCPNG